MMILPPHPNPKNGPIDAEGNAPDRRRAALSSMDEVDVALRRFGAVQLDDAGFTEAVLARVRVAPASLGAEPVSASPGAVVARLKRRRVTHGRIVRASRIGLAIGTAGWVALWGLGGGGDPLPGVLQAPVLMAIGGVCWLAAWLAWPARR